MLKLTMAITPAIIPTHRGVLRVKRVSGSTGLLATLSSTKTKMTKKTGKMTAMAILNGSCAIDPEPPVRDKS